MKNFLDNFRRELSRHKFFLVRVAPATVICNTRMADDGWGEVNRCYDQNYLSIEVYSAKHGISLLEQAYEEIIKAKNILANGSTLYRQADAVRSFLEKDIQWMLPKKVSFFPEELLSSRKEERDTFSPGVYLIGIREGMRRTLSSMRTELEYKRKFDSLTSWGVNDFSPSTELEGDQIAFLLGDLIKEDYL